MNNNINFRNVSYINDTGMPDENNETIIPAFTSFEVFPRFSPVPDGTTSNIEVNFDAMFSGTNRWNKTKSYAKDVYVTIYNAEQPLESKIYKTINSVPSGIDIDNTDYWQDETSTYFEIKADGNAYHKYINSIPAGYTQVIRIRSTFDPSKQNVIIDWGDGTSNELSNAYEMHSSESLFDILGSKADGSRDIIFVKTEQFIDRDYGKNECYSYYCYHDYMPAMVDDKIVQVITNEDETITIKQGLPDKPYKVLIYGTSYMGLVLSGISSKYIIKPENYSIQERTKVAAFSTSLLSRIFTNDLQLYHDIAITLSSIASGAKNLLYINIPKYFNGFNLTLNTYEMFKNCTNLQYCNGFNNKLRFKSVRGMCRMFSGCKNLIKCDVKLAKHVLDYNIDSVHDGNKEVFKDCTALAVDLLSLLPLDGFSAKYMNLINTFCNCKSLDTTTNNIERIKQILWKDLFKIWKTYDNNNSTATFYGCSQLSMYGYIPNGWINAARYIDPDYTYLEIPKLLDVIYNGQANTIQLVNDGYSIDNNSIITATDAGKYYITLKLNAGYIWSDNSLNNKTITWNIIKATNEWTTEPELSETKWTEGDTSVTLTNGVAKFGEVVMKLNNEDFTNLPTEQGKYTLTFNVDGTNNYSGLNKTIGFEILKPEVIEPEEIDLNFNLEHGEVKTGLGENGDEVALIFKNSDLDTMNWTVPCDLENVELLVVGGGGGGGGHYYSSTAKNCQGGAGGGAGAVVTGFIKDLVANQVVNVTVGAGGAGGAATTSAKTGAGKGGNGGNSVLKVDDVTYVTAYGGGGDGGYNSTGVANGGSNSGARANKTATDLKSVTVVGEGADDLVSDVISHVNKGGTGYNTDSGYPGAGGGGAGGNGGAAPGSNYGGTCGYGYVSMITGTRTVYGSGGGGGIGKDGGVSTYIEEKFKPFIEGAGLGTAKQSGSNAVANQGGGGGGGSWKKNGGAGGSGIVVLRFKLNNKKIKLTSLNPTNYSTIPVVTTEMKDLLALSNSGLANKFSVAHTDDSPNQVRLDLKNLYQSKNSIPVELKWTGGDNTKYSVSLWRTNIDSEDNPQFTAETTDTSVKFYDLEVGRNYSWTVIDNSGEKITGQFFTEENDPSNNNFAPRIIRSQQDNVSYSECTNGRDLGGYITTITDENGNKLRTKQGLIFRSGDLEWCNTFKDELNERCLGELNQLKNILKIKNELDLRENSVIEYFKNRKLSWKNYQPFTNILEESTIGENVKRISIENISGLKSVDINGLFNKADNQTMQQNRKVFWKSFNEIYKSVKNDEPILFHCSHGKDRTGALAFVILCYLGVPVDVATKDFILAWATNQDETLSLTGLNTFKTNVATLNSNSSGTLTKEDFYNLLKVCGKAAGELDEDIDIILGEFRDLMLETVEKSINPLTFTSTGDSTI